MRNVKVTIEGISPGILMRRFGESSRDGIVQGGGPVTTIPAREAAAEEAAYRLPDVNGEKGNLYIPAECLRQALVLASAYEKGKGRSTLAKFSAAAIFITPEALDLGVKIYDIDSRPAVIPATKGRVMRHRPNLKQWRVTFNLEYDETLLTIEQVRRIVEHCGARVGLLDYRAAKRGPFGRFHIVLWEPF